jgi:benzoyl-CoA reductase subunit A
VKGFLGIDLGSTTTKAVFLLPDASIAGRGLTHTRANFETACAVARADALADARFSLLSRPSLNRSSDPQSLEGIAARARATYRSLRRLERMATLTTRCQAIAAASSGGQRLSAAISDLLRALGPLAVADGEAEPDLPALAASHAAAAAEKYGVTDEEVLVAFDKAYIAVEAEPTRVTADQVLTSLREQRPSDAILEAIDRAQEEPLEIVAQSGTGYGRHRLPFEKSEIRSEILCHGLGAHHAFPATRTVIDIGGQDTKAIQLDERGLVTSFQMNDRCAAGCGRYLGYVAEELSMNLSDLGPLALCSACPSQINSTCTVFAGAEIRERLSLGEKREDVVAGLHRAIVQRAIALVSRAGGVKPQVTFSGGVARNPAVVRFLGDAIHRHYGKVAVNVSEDSILNGAIGAALFARMEAASC